MSGKLFAKISEELFQTAEIIDLRGWGESAIVPNFTDYARRAFDSGATVRLVTNLSYNKPQLLAYLVLRGAWIDLSIDTLDEKALQVVRPGARVELLRNNLRRLTALRRNTTMGRLRVLLTIQRPCLDNLRATVTELLSCGIRELVITPVRALRTSLVSLADHESEVAEHIAWIEAAGSACGARITLGGILTPTDKFVRPQPCIHPWTHAYIRFDGAVGYCDHLIGPFFEKELMGTVTSVPFINVWNNERWQGLRHVHARALTSCKVYKNCHKCYHSRLVDYEPLLLVKQ
jgi:hypothetical protein